MKLVFKKDEQYQIEVNQVVDGEEKKFSYIEMIRSLIDLKPLDVPGLQGEFTDPEKKSINTMIEYINKTAIVSETSVDEIETISKDNADTPKG